MPQKNTSSIVDTLLRHEDAWCKAMGYFNPYLDPFKNHLRGDVPVYDSACYDKYPKHQFVYDKLWVAQSQGLEAGMVGDLLRDGSGPSRSLALPCHASSHYAPRANSPPSLGSGRWLPMWLFAAWPFEV